MDPNLVRNYDPTETKIKAVNILTTGIRLAHIDEQLRTNGVTLGIIEEKIDSLAMEVEKIDYMDHTYCLNKKIDTLLEKMDTLTMEVKEIRTLCAFPEDQKN